MPEPALRLVPRDDTADLRERRATLARALADAQAAAASVRSAEGEERGLLAALEALNLEHTDRIRQWAREGAKGEMPGQDVGEATRLGDRLRAAQAQATAARGALADLDGEQVRLSAELARIDAALFDRALADAHASVAGLVEKARARVAEAEAHVAEAFGLAAMLQARGQTLQGTGHTDEARRFFTLATAAYGLVPSLAVEPTTAAVQEQAAAWRARLAGTTGGVL
ncbi:hypothetical protein FF100_33530 [Methylobacterium terricola]|uniref:Uncharacterized protein n=1 Tax=Methylobacterium terricola TaxID=2583531 RepID=A0A5C4L609_9HYPH|nr:hypothetical protein [Methylobacterium terricola]TNC07097.1 hypothetical protein FF100_33530 [Methylobacterium terricola]